jgi:hypothetical protein
MAAIDHSDILIVPVNNAFVSPVCYIGNRRGITNIVVQAEFLPAKAVMASVNVHAVAEYMGFAVRYIFI